MMFLTFIISQGTVGTHLRDIGTLNINFILILLVSLSVNEFLQRDAIHVVYAVVCVCVCTCLTHAGIV